MIPQIVILINYMVLLLIEANMHGKHKTGKHNFWIAFTGISINFALLYWGGFFKGMF